MKPLLEFPLTDEILTSFALAIGADPVSYTHLTLPTNREV